MKIIISLTLLCFVLSYAGLAQACNAQVQFVMDTKAPQRQQLSGVSSGIAGHLSGNTTIGLYPQMGGSGSGCAGLRSLEIRITTTSVIGVTQSYPYGSCQHNVVTAHENKHLQVMNTFFASVPSQYKGKVQAMLSGGVSQSTLQQISSVLMTDINRSHHDLQYQNVDRPDLMQQELARCPGW